MIDQWLTHLDDPLIKNALLSALSLILVLILMIFVRRLFHFLKIEDYKKQRWLKWISHAGLLLAFMIIVRIWAYTYLLQLFQPDVVGKILTTVIGLLTTVLIIFTFRRIIAAQKISPTKQHQYRQGATYAFILFYGLVLVRVWAYSGLFDFFRNPVVEKLLRSALALAIVYLALFFVRRYINSMKIEIAQRHQYRKRVGYLAGLVYIIILIPIWAGSTQQWATVLSVMGAGIALALHEALLNIAGWIYIMIRRPYKTGDRIELGDVRGDVIDIQVFQTTLLEIGNWVDGDQSTGRVVHLPHGQIFRNSLYNYTKGFEYLWHEFSILITFESDWEKAKEIMLKCGETESEEIQEEVKKKVDRMSREYLIYYKKFTPIVYTKIEDSGVKLMLRYLTDVRKRRTGVDNISQKALRAIGAASDIEFAYPTYRIYQRGEEGNGSAEKGR